MQRRRPSRVQGVAHGRIQVPHCPSETNTCCSLLPSGHGGRPDQRGRTAGALQAAPAPQGRGSGVERGHLLLDCGPGRGSPHPQDSPSAVGSGGARRCSSERRTHSGLCLASGWARDPKRAARGSLGMGPAVGCPRLLGTGPAAGCARQAGHRTHTRAAPRLPGRGTHSGACPGLSGTYIFI